MKNSAMLKVFYCIPVTDKIGFINGKKKMYKFCE